MKVQEVFHYTAYTDYKKAGEIYLKMSDEKILIPDRIRYVYDAYCKKGYSYIEEIEKIIISLEEEEKTEYYALLADMYKNKGDQEKSDEYRALVMQRIKS